MNEVDEHEEFPFSIDDDDREREQNCPRRRRWRSSSSTSIGAFLFRCCYSLVAVYAFLDTDFLVIVQSVLGIGFSFALSLSLSRLLRLLFLPSSWESRDRTNGRTRVSVLYSISRIPTNVGFRHPSTFSEAERNPRRFASYSYILQKIDTDWTLIRERTGEREKESEGTRK